MTALTLQASSPTELDASTAVMRPGALLHRVRMAAAAVWRLAPGRYFAIPDGDSVVVLPLGRAHPDRAAHVRRHRARRQHRVPAPRAGARTRRRRRDRRRPQPQRRLRQRPARQPGARCTTATRCRSATGCCASSTSGADVGAERGPHRAVRLEQPAVVVGVGLHGVLREEADARRARVAPDRARPASPPAARASAAARTRGRSGASRRSAGSPPSVAYTSGPPSSARRPFQRPASCARMRADAVAAQLAVVVVVERPDPVVAALEPAPPQRRQQRLDERLALGDPPRAGRTRRRRSRGRGRRRRGRARAAIPSTVAIMNETRSAMSFCGHIWRLGSLMTSKYAIRPA